jgi:hypothetical protein
MKDLETYLKSLVKEYSRDLYWDGKKFLKFKAAEFAATVVSGIRKLALVQLMLNAAVVSWVALFFLSLAGIYLAHTSENQSFFEFYNTHKIWGLVLALFLFTTFLTAYLFSEKNWMHWSGISSALEENTASPKESVVTKDEILFEIDRKLDERFAKLEDYISRQNNPASASSVRKKKAS